MPVFVKYLPIMNYLSCNVANNGNRLLPSKKEAPPRDAPLFHKDNAAQFGGTLRAVYFIVLILRKSR